MTKIIFIIIAAVLILGGGYFLFVKTSGEQNGTNTPVGSNTINTAIDTVLGKKLDLSNRGLEKIPSSVFSQANLEELDVSGNRLTGAIQAEIRHLSNLKVLRAGNNQMTGVPAEIGQLQKLEVLDLSNNRLTGLPYELGNLKALQILNLSGNLYSKQDLDYIKSKLPSATNIIVNQ